MTMIYIGAGMVALGLLALGAIYARSNSEPTGVAKSLAMIQSGGIDDRMVTKRELPAQERLVGPFLNGMRRIAQRLSPARTTERLAISLDRAGNPPEWTIERIMGLKGMGGLLGFVLGLVYDGVGVSGFLFGLVFAAIGFWVPDLLIYNLGLRRRDETAKGLAEALDMLTVCVQAGQGFDAALLQVARNVEGPIAGEFARVLSEMQLGKSRGEAFAGMGTRVNLPAVRNFVTAMVQADRLGLPIANVLREQTAEMRLERKQKAEEMAQKITVKILFPLLLCIFPVMFIVIIGPGIIRLAENFFALSG